VGGPDRMAEKDAFGSHIRQGKKIHPKKKKKNTIMALIFF
jgi:hypothetical protein